MFRAVPRKDWCTEVKRFNEEVANDMVALSGMKFFYLTRSLVLSVAGTIVGQFFSNIFSDVLDILYLGDV